MKNRFAVNPALDEHATDVLFAESPPPGMDDHGGMLRESNRLDQMNLILILCLVLSFPLLCVAFCVFSVPDRYKQKHNSKKAEEGI